MPTSICLRLGLYLNAQFFLNFLVNIEFRLKDVPVHFCWFIVMFTVYCLPTFGWLKELNDLLFGGLWINRIILRTRQGHITRDRSDINCLTYFIVEYE